MKFKNPVTIKTELEKLISYLIGRGISTDQNFPALRSISNSICEVTFASSEFVSLAMGDVDYETLYDELSLNRSYSIKLVDGGLLQLMYLFEQENIIKHRLAYYPSPHLRSFQDDYDSYERDEIFMDILLRRIIPFPVRFDYDASAAINVHHPHSHLTLGDVKGCRIPATGPLSPADFLGFILRNFYQSSRINLVDDMPQKSFSLPRSITRDESSLIHIHIP